MMCSGAYLACYPLYSDASLAWYLKYAKIGEIQYLVFWGMKVGTFVDQLMPHSENTVFGDVT